MLREPSSTRNMSDAAVMEQSVHTVPGSPGQKRKREDSPYDDRAKRAPPANMSVSADTQAYIDTIDGHGASNGVNVADFDALQQATQDEHHHTDGPDPSSATSTAQAVLGMYPTLHVPPSTEEQFAAQMAAEGGDHDGNPANNFGQDMPHPGGLIDTTSPVQGAQTPSNGMPPGAHRYSTSMSGGTPKPTVGSEEWHKMRKDNHKEGRHTFLTVILKKRFEFNLVVMLTHLM